MNRAIQILVGLLVLGVIAISQVFFIVYENNQAIVTQLGEYLYTASSPGLYAKLPFVQAVSFMERRLLASDAPPQEYLTLDKKRLRVDHVTFWRITDPLRFYVTVGTEAGARARIDDVVFSEMRRQLANRNFDEVIADQRQPIMDAVAANVRTQAESFGIHVEDVRIKRADLPKEVEESVFNRMRAERSREANRYRAEGEEQKAQIQAGADRQRTVTLADAQEQSERTRGEGDAQAIKIFASALGQDPEFYSFRRRLEAYENLMRAGDTLVVPSDTEFFNYLMQSSGTRAVTSTVATRAAALEP